MRISIGLILIALLIACNSLTIRNAEASSPSVLEFTLKYIDQSYDVPSSATTTTDPYTGEKTVITSPGSHVQKGTIEVKIKNQQFTPYSNGDGQIIYLFYNVSYKGHYQNEWTYYPSGGYGRDSTGPTRIAQSTSEYTVLSFNAPSEGAMDFRVRAQIGYYTEYQMVYGLPGDPTSYYTFFGEVGSWSEPETVTITTNESTKSPVPTYTTGATSAASKNPTINPTPLDNQTSTFSNLSWEITTLLVGLVAAVAALAVGMLLLWRRLNSKPVS
jgi:hypothetical protein